MHGYLKVVHHKVTNVKILGNKKSWKFFHCKENIRIHLLPLVTLKYKGVKVLMQAFGAKVLLVPWTIGFFPPFLNWPITSLLHYFFDQLELRYFTTNSQVDILIVYVAKGKIFLQIYLVFSSLGSAIPLQLLGVVLWVVATRWTKAFKGLIMYFKLIRLI